MSRRSSESNPDGTKRRKSPYERQIERYDQIRDAYAGSVNNLLGAIEDDFNPCTGINLIRRDDGGYLAILKRDLDLTPQVLMAYGEDTFTALIALNKKVAAGVWKKDTPWEPPKKGGAKKKT